MLLKDFADEIEKLKSELTCHRQRNGLYLINDAYEDITAVSESRRMVLEEQSAKIGTLDANLRNKTQELFALITTLLDLKKENELTKMKSDEIMEVLDHIEHALTATRKTLGDETQIRKVHEKTEDNLADVGDQLISTLHRTIDKVGGLHAKNKRKSDLQALNQAAWNAMQGQVSSLTSIIERRVTELRDEQTHCFSTMSSRMQKFVHEESKKLSLARAFVKQQIALVGDSQRDLLLHQGGKFKYGIDESIDEVSVIRDAVMQRVEQGEHGRGHSR